MEPSAREVVEALDAAFDKCCTTSGRSNDAAHREKDALRDALVALLEAGHDCRVHVGATDHDRVCSCVVVYDEKRAAVARAMGRK
jgi:hypothetical protein